jgi:hypothetical protein
MQEGEELPPLKPYANLTKSGFAILAEHVRENTHPPSAGNAAVDVVTEGLKIAFRFDVTAKPSTEDYKKMYDGQKKKAEKAGITVYEKNHKKRYERLKKEYPNVPTSILVGSKKGLEEYVKTHQK